MPRILALTGPAGVGKTTVAVALVRRFGWDRVSLAAPIKAMLSALYAEAGLDALQIERRIMGDRKELPDAVLCECSPRRAMQTLGTEWGRQRVAAGLWAEIARRRALTCLADGAPGVVLDDCRYENEAAMVRDLGGQVVGLTRRGIARRHDHASEAGVSTGLVIANDGPPEAVAEAIWRLCPHHPA